MTTQTAYVQPLGAVPGNAQRILLSAATGPDFVALDDSTAKGTWAATNISGRVLASGALVYGGNSTWHAVVYGQTLALANMPVLVTAILTTADGQDTRAVWRWLVRPIAPAGSRYTPNQARRVAVTNYQIQAVTQTGLIASGTLTAVDAEGRGVTVFSGALSTDGVTGEWFAVLPQTVMLGIGYLAGAGLLVTAQMLDLGGNQILTLQWMMRPSW